MEQLIRIQARIQSKEFVHSWMLTKEPLPTCAYKFHTGELNNNSFLPDPKKDWYTENAPLQVKIEQDKDEKIAKIKHSMRTPAELTLEPHNTRLRKFIQEFRKRFYFPDIYEKMRFHIKKCATCIQT